MGFPLEWFAQRFELSRGGDAHNVRPMEGLRGFAVFLVFLVHYVALVNPWVTGQEELTGFAKALHAIGNSGVDLFFVLSGFLIYGSLIARPQKFGRFMWRRVVRIYPAFIAVFAVYVLLSVLMPSQSKIPPGLDQGLLYLLANALLLPGIFPIEPMITVAWSLSYEMFYYLAIPLVIALCGMRARGPSWRAAFFALAAIAWLLYCAVFGGPVRLAMFVSGILLYESVQSRTLLGLKSGHALVALVLGLLATLLPVHGGPGISIKVGALFVCFFVVCLVCFRYPAGWLPTFFTWTPLRWLGNMSYSYYLLHGLALKAAFVVLAVLLPTGQHGMALFWGLMPGMFAVTLVPTAILFLAVERPLSLAQKKDVSSPVALSPTNV